jgi:hypothetical protein
MDNRATWCQPQWCEQQWHELRALPTLGERVTGTSALFSHRLSESPAPELPVTFTPRIVTFVAPTSRTIAAVDEQFPWKHQLPLLSGVLAGTSRVRQSTVAPSACAAGITFQPQLLSSVSWGKCSRFDDSKQ